MATSRFTATAERDDRWWVVQCDQVPDALSQVARLDQAAEHQAEAIALVTGLEEIEIEVHARPAPGHGCGVCSKDPSG